MSAILTEEPRREVARIQDIGMAKVRVEVWAVAVLMVSKANRDFFGETESVYERAYDAFCQIERATGRLASQIHPLENASPRFSCAVWATEASLRSNPANAAVGLASVVCGLASMTYWDA